MLLIADKPVVKPVIQYVVEKAPNCALDNIVFITGRGEPAIENHKINREYGQALRCLVTPVEANRHQKQVTAHKVKEHFCTKSSGSLKDRSFALWGLAFKANTDDIREAMPLELIESLTGQNAETATHDFEAMNNVCAKVDDHISFAGNPLTACKGSYALTITTE